MLKFQAVAEKMAKNFRGYFFSAAPCILLLLVTIEIGMYFFTIWICEICQLVFVHFFSNSE